MSDNFIDMISSRINTWDNKVDKVTGKGLSTEDYTTVEKQKLSILANYDDTELRNLVNQLKTSTDSSYVITPEQFGAMGDGVTDDYVAFRNLVAYVNSLGAAIINFKQEAIYKINRYVGDGLQPIVARLTFEDLSSLVLNGNGAKIVFKGDFLQTKDADPFGGYYRSSKTTIGMTINRSKNIEIYNLEIDGQGILTSMESGVNGESSGNNGFTIGGCENVLISNLNVHNFTCDAFIVGENESNKTGQWLKYHSENLTILNSIFEYGARNVCTLGVVKNLSFIGCKFTHGGDSGNNIFWSPGLAIDIEPDQGIGTGYGFDTSHVEFLNCSFSDSNGGIIAVPQPFVSNVKFDNCDFMDTTSSKVYSFALIGDNIAVENSRLKIYSCIYFDKLDQNGAVYFKNNTINVVDTSLVVITSDTKSPCYFIDNDINIVKETKGTSMPIYCSSNLLIMRGNTIFISKDITETNILLRGCRECSDNTYITDRTSGSKFGLCYRWARIVNSEIIASNYIVVAEPADIATNTVYSNLPQDVSYTLPIASSTALGGIKVGANLNINSDGTLSVNQATMAGTNQLSWYNAKTYGAKGDGITDDTPALQKLIENVYNAGGGVIYIPKGKYMLDSSLYWLSNISLYGDGIGKSILATRRNGPTWQVKHSAITWNSTATIAPYNLFGGNGEISGAKVPFENCNFIDFEVDGSGVISTDNQYSVAVKGIFIQYLRNCSFRNLYIHDTIATGLGVDFLDKSIIENVVCKNDGRGYMAMTGGSLGGAGIGIGTGGMSSENLIITNCETDGCGSNGIFVENQKLFDTNLAAYPADGVIISNCICKNNRYNGLGISGGKAVKIADCVVYNNKDGINVNTIDAEDLLISNNIVYNNTSTGIITSGPSLKKVSIIGNILENNSLVNNATVAEDFFIKDNMIIGATLSTGTGIGFTVDNNKIDGKGKVAEGMYIYPLVNSVITNNSIINNGITTGNPKPAYSFGNGKSTGNLFQNLIFRNNNYILSDTTLKSSSYSSLALQQITFTNSILSGNTFDFTTGDSGRFLSSNSIIENYNKITGAFGVSTRYKYASAKVASRVGDFTGVTKLKIEFGVNLAQTNKCIISKNDYINGQGWRISYESDKICLFSNVINKATTLVLNIDNYTVNTRRYYRILADTSLQIFSSPDNITWTDITSTMTGSTITYANIASALSLNTSNNTVIFGRETSVNVYDLRATMIQSYASDILYYIAIYKTDLTVAENLYNFRNYGNGMPLIDENGGATGEIVGFGTQSRFNYYGA